MLALKENGRARESAAESISNVCSSDITAEQEKIKASAAEIAKRLSDYVKVLKPRLIIVADRAILAARPLERLVGLFLPLPDSATGEHVCRLVQRESAAVRGIVLADAVGWDVDELARQTGKAVLTLGGGAQ